jgi:hypothetical protein
LRGKQRAIMPGNAAIVKAQRLIRINVSHALVPRLAQTGEPSMIGITLTAEQVRNAPAPVRQWIEQELVASFSLAPRPPAVAPPPPAHLVACSVEDMAGVLEHIRGVFPAVNVLLEFGRPGISYGQPAVMTFRLIDVLHHTRLQDVGQVITCLEMINQALTEVKKDPAVRFCGFDNEGHCLIAPQTQASIATLWQTMTERQQAQQANTADTRTADRIAPAA